MNKQSFLNINKELVELAQIKLRESLQNHSASDSPAKLDRLVDSLFSLTNLIARLDEIEKENSPVKPITGFVKVKETTEVLEV